MSSKCPKKHISLFHTNNNPNFLFIFNKVCFIPCCVLQKTRRISVLFFFLNIEFCVKSYRICIIDLQSALKLLGTLPENEQNQYIK